MFFPQKNGYRACWAPDIIKAAGNINALNVISSQQFMNAYNSVKMTGKVMLINNNTDIPRYVSAQMASDPINLDPPSRPPPSASAKAKI
ncbi:MAG: hypothetical protein HQK76_05110 [Desulfobacterales bacterium]|nr:hypothetical protein [Desulfobacterales bacterium]